MGRKDLSRTIVLVQLYAGDTLLIETKFRVSLLSFEMPSVLLVADLLPARLGVHGVGIARTVLDDRRAGPESEALCAQPVAHQLGLEARNLARSEVGHRYVLAKIKVIECLMQG